MSRYIDADELERLIDLHGAYSIKDVPYIDIVRCKECRHWTYEELCEVFTKPMCFDDYCSYGERKESE